MGRRPSWEPAYCEYFAARQKPFMRTAYGIVGSWATAEDATQATFAKLYAYWPRIQGDSIDAYARRVLVNTCIGTFRATKHEIVSPDIPEHSLEADPGERLDIISAMRRLSARDRAVLTLRFLDDLSIADVADALELPPGTVKSRTSRALARLEAILAPTYQPQTSQGNHHAT